MGVFPHCEMTNMAAVQKSLSGLHPLEYEHGFDRVALNTLQQTPGLDLLIRQFNKLAVERMITVRYTGSNVRINRNSLPSIYALLDRACEVINLPERPDFYVEHDSHVNGFTVGVDHPIIVLTSGSIDHLTDDELLFLIGHEVGHIKSRHTLYHQMARWFLPGIVQSLGQATLGLGGFVSGPVQSALTYWSRMSEFTADRAGLLACQDIGVAVRVMMKWAGVPKRFYGEMKWEQFVEQAREFDQLDKDLLSMIYKAGANADSTHPWTVVRTAELLKWFEGDDYPQILSRATGDRQFVKREGKQAICRHCDYRLDGAEKFCPCCGSALSVAALSSA